MSAFALTLVLSAAFMHASWNAIVKNAGDRALTLAAVAAMHTVGGLLLIAVSAPPAPASWPSLFASTIIHYLYYLLLFQAYRLGDLSQVYPISRGLAPALVALGAYLIVGETLTSTGWAGLAAICIGIGLLAIQRGAASADRTAVMFAVFLGLSISAYSVADGIGVRWSESPTGYMGWLFFLEAPVVLAVLGPRLARRQNVDWSAFSVGLIGGALSVLAYGLVLYAKTFAPIAAVSAVRESSVIIAALIGVLMFGERPWKGRVLAALVVATGVILIASA
ncbi:EamA family transporter [Mesorhizobium sp. CAU 1741]|uniref:EamA family transporter n=1 Tax=Mesorhizobium sp. CAU 1741 TaxID=3140366 RepID=UPI00325C27FD